MSPWCHWLMPSSGLIAQCCSCPETICPLPVFEAQVRPKKSVPGWWLSIFFLLPQHQGFSYWLSKVEQCCDKLNYLPHSTLTGPYRCSHSPAFPINSVVVGYHRTSLGLRVLGICKVAQCNGPLIWGNASPKHTEYMKLPTEPNCMSCSSLLITYLY